MYIVWCNVHPTISRENVPTRRTNKKGITKSHAFVYDSDFNTLNIKTSYEAIIDNRKHSYLRAFFLEDSRDMYSVRKSLEKYFLGKTII